MTEITRVTIGLPVYNGEKYIEQALESLLDQTFQDFTVIISDNASTDRTPLICRRYAEQFANIQFHASDVNKGAGWNFRRVFELSRSPYFKWMACDDLIAPTYLDACVEALDADAAAVLAYPLTTVINENGETIEKYQFNVATSSSVASKRFHDLLFGSDQCYEVFGLIRSDCLRQSQVMGGYGHADGVLLGQLSLMGHFQRVEQYLFYSRRHAKQSIREHDEGDEGGRPNYNRYTEWFDTSTVGTIKLPNWRILSENLKCVYQSSVSMHDKVACYFYLGKWMKRHRRFLLDDLRNAVQQLARRPLGGRRRILKSKS